MRHPRYNDSVPLRSCPGADAHDTALDKQGPHPMLNRAYSPGSIASVGAAHSRATSSIIGALEDSRLNLPGE